MVSRIALCNKSRNFAGERINITLNARFEAAYDFP